MFPSPSLGPPLLSASASPALDPCGIPLELEPGDVDEGGVVAVVPDGLDDCVDGFAAGVDELEEFEPQSYLFGAVVVAITVNSVAALLGQ